MEGWVVGFINNRQVVKASSDGGNDSETLEEGESNAKFLRGPNLQRPDDSDRDGGEGDFSHNVNDGDCYPSVVLQGVSTNSVARKAYDSLVQCMSPR